MTSYSATDMLVKARSIKIMKQRIEALKKTQDVAAPVPAPSKQPPRKQAEVPRNQQILVQAPLVQAAREFQPPKEEERPEGLGKPKPPDNDIPKVVEVPRAQRISTVGPLKEFPLQPDMKHSINAEVFKNKIQPNFPIHMRPGASSIKKPVPQQIREVGSVMPPNPREHLRQDKDQPRATQTVDVVKPSNRSVIYVDAINEEQRALRSKHKKILDRYLDIRNSGTDATKRQPIETIDEQIEKDLQHKLSEVRRKIDRLSRQNNKK